MRNGNQTHKSAPSADAKFPPADNCLFCGISGNAVEGLMIVSQQERGILLNVPPRKGSRKGTHISIQIPNGHVLMLKYWGEKALWEPVIIERVMEAALAGRHPWFCQKCGDRVCRTCAEPLIYPVGSDVIHDDGDIRHVPIWPFHVGCNNHKCLHHGIKR